MYTTGVKVLKMQRWAKVAAAFIAASLGIFLTVTHTDFFDTKPTVSMPPANALYLDPSQPIEARVADLLSYMTLEEKIGQMTLVEKNSVKRSGDIAVYHMGGLLSGAGAKPAENTAAGWKEMIDGYQSEAATSRLGVPLLYGADAIHGHALVPGATVFPHAIGLGATGNPDLVKKVAQATAQEMVVTGVNWSFGPNLDQPQDIRWGRTYEVFSDDPKLVSELGAAYLVGLQLDSKVLAAPKHYLGLGAMEWNTSLNKDFKIDQGVTPADDDLLRARYLPPFIESIDAGALSIMVGLNTWGEKRMVFQKYLLTDVLKQELGFKGFLVSDWYGVHEGQSSTFLATVKAVNAGIDMVMLPFDYEMFTNHMKWANRLGLVSEERINDAAGRILYAKFASGLFDKKAEVELRGIPNDTHLTLAREAVAQSLVLLKNEEAVLPIQENVQHIRVAGGAADNVGRQMGAWSIEWQGIDGNWPVGATSILAGIQEQAASRDIGVEYNRLGSFSTERNKADIGIAVVGEKPYAEGWGDKEYPTLDAEDLLAIKNLQASSEKVIVIVVSGRPLLIADEVDSFDGLVAAWLPGSEGVGVSDVLFGDKPFTGKLPLSWPRSLQQLPIALDETTADATPVLFPRYFGLKY
jgi:beta-glucosidase